MTDRTIIAITLDWQGIPLEITYAPATTTLYTPIWKSRSWASSLRSSQSPRLAIASTSFMRKMSMPGAGLAPMGTHG